MAALPDTTFTTLLRDFESLKTEMIKRIEYFCPEWTDRSTSDPGIALINIFAYVLDAYHWVNEMILNESFLATCKRRSSLLLHLRQLGTDLIPPAAATVNCDITVVSATGNSLIGGVTLPNNWQVQCALPDDSITFELYSPEEDVVLSAVGQTITVPFIEGTSVTTPISLGNSDGKPFQKYTLATKDILHNPSQKTIRCFVGASATEWTLVDTLAFSTPSDTHFCVKRNSLDVPEICFGDGEAGAIPTLGDNITTTYRIGGGIRGNKASAGTITQIRGAIPTGVRLSITNPTAASGGSDWERFEVARRRGPAYWATQDRAVTKDDYTATILSEVTSITKCMCEPTAYSNVHVWLVPLSGGQATLAQRAAVLLALQDKMGTDAVTIGMYDPSLADTRSVIYAGINIALTARVYDNYSQELTRQSVYNTVVDWMSIAERNFGEAPVGYLYTSDLVDQVMDVSGVYAVDFTLFQRAIEPIWIYKQGECTISNASTTANVLEDKWWIEWRNKDTYWVWGETFGGQGLGVMGSPFTSYNGMVSFTLSTGAVPMAAGDKLWFKTSKRVGNVAIEANEFPSASNIIITINGGY